MENIIIGRVVPKKGSDMSSKGLKFLESKQKINKPREAYRLFISNWKSNELERYKSAKAILLNNRDEAFAIYDIPHENKNVPIDKGNLKLNESELFKIASEHQAKAVIIAENYLPKDILADDARVEYVENLKRKAYSYNLAIDDFVSMYNNFYSSFKQQKITLK